MTNLEVYYWSLGFYTSLILTRFGPPCDEPCNCSTCELWNSYYIFFEAIGEYLEEEATP